MQLPAQRLGYQTPLEIEKAVQNVCTDIKLQEEFFKSVDRLGGDRSFKEQQYIAIGMKPHNAKLLNDYMMLKNYIQEQKNPPVIEDDLVNESNVINKKQLLQSIYPKSILLNDSTVLRKEIFDVIGGGDKEIEFKTTIAKEYSYIDEKNDEDRLKIILFSTKEKETTFFDILIMTEIEEKGTKKYKSVENMSFLRRRLHLDKSKKNINGFKTVKENGRTFFVINYTDENNKRKSDYYTIDLKLIKTLQN